MHEQSVRSNSLLSASKSVFVIVILQQGQWWKVTKYINLSTSLRYLHFTFYIFCYFILLLHYISEVNIVLFTALYLFHNFSNQLLFRLIFNVLNMITSF